MPKKVAIKRIGILTAGGDCPGLNAAIRAVGKACIGQFGIEVMGIYDGFRGLAEGNARRLGLDEFSGLLTLGGTILGTGRDKPEKLRLSDGSVVDGTEMCAQRYRELGLDCLVCLGGNGTQRNALHLMNSGIRVLTLPKTIDNDIWGTDVTFGHDTAVTIATEAIDRLHSTAESHQRIMVLEVMGNRAGWIALAAGIAGGADIILIPEIPYDPRAIAGTVASRGERGRRFSIVAVAEGAFSQQEIKAAKKAGAELPKVEDREVSAGATVAKELAQLTGLETRFTVLGYVQRGGTPTPADRILATRVGTYAAELLAKGKTGVLVGIRADECVAVPLEECGDKRKIVPTDHPMIRHARLVGTCFGDKC
jgi:6-phosphofructokinase 1